MVSPETKWGKVCKWWVLHKGSLWDYWFQEPWVPPAGRPLSSRKSLGPEDAVRCTHVDWELHRWSSTMVISRDCVKKIWTPEQWLHHSLGVWPWANYLTSLCLSLLIYKMGIIVTYLIFMLWRVYELVFVRHLEQCLAPSKSYINACLLNKISTD